MKAEAGAEVEVEILLCNVVVSNDVSNEITLPGSFDHIGDIGVIGVEGNGV